ncbi:hypothetical protein, partial [Siminovitchia fortis]|uniref:hypothetical protein n=1 Tax=Siminovitchia fortis TaxID=254758 RepID=UPI001C9315A7
YKNALYSTRFNTGLYTHPATHPFSHIHHSLPDYHPFPAPLQKQPNHPPHSSYIYPPYLLPI